MTDETINNDVTMGGGANGTLLAGRYRVIRQLGQGGMGSVWLAEDAKLDNFQVAIKMLPSVLVNNKRAYAQVKQEALVSLKLSHPNIATVRAFEEEGGSPFLVMDYIDGQTLDDYLAEKGKLTEDETIKLLKPVAAALDYAHAQGVVHRDVKPGNVMIRRDGVPFVLDFGIAREIQETMTRVTGKLSSGTLMYMSPEQLNGAAPKPAQDVYSFAAMAYECLKGAPPFSRGQIEYQILSREPEPLPSESALAKRILRGLAKEPAERPVDCKGVLTAVVVARPQRRPIPRQTPVVESTPSRMKWFVLVALLLLGAAIWLKMGPMDASAFRNGGSAVRDTRSAREIKDATDNARVEALVQMEACRRLNRNDGFGAKVQECEDLIARAQAEYELKRWGKSEAAYNEAHGKAKDLVALSQFRDSALEAFARMEKLAREAKAAQADVYAKARFDVAKKKISEARLDFDAMRFEEAARGYAWTAEQFSLARDEAAREKVRRQNWRKTETAYTIKPGELDLVMKWCPSGSFEMGSPDTEDGRMPNEKLHRVTLTKGFWIGETEVTQGQWKRIVDGETVIDLARKGLREDAPVLDDGNWRYFRDLWGLERDGDPIVRCGDLDDAVPVYNLTWSEAMKFCRRINEMERAAGCLPDGYAYRLPTEAEWEYACRAGSRVSPFDEQSVKIIGEHNAPVLDPFAWYGGNSSSNFVGRGVDTFMWKERQFFGGRAFARKVKEKRPNAWGLYDMIGNVAEWCGDSYVDYPPFATDPFVAQKNSTRICRGGGWSWAASWSRPSSRGWNGCGTRRNDIGFRIVLAPQYEGYPQLDVSLTAEESQKARELAERYHEERVKNGNRRDDLQSVVQLFRDGKSDDAYGKVTDEMRDNTEIQYWLGWYFDGSNWVGGKENPHKDSFRAVEWYQKAVAGGHSTAMVRLGLHYAAGDGVPKDGQKAAQLYRRSAALGDSVGLQIMGQCSWFGGLQEIPKDRRNAMAYFKAAAERGNGWSALNLAQRYAGYWGVAQGGESEVSIDYALAGKYARLALKLDCAEAKVFLAKLIIGGKIAAEGINAEALLEEYAALTTVNNMVIALAYRNGDIVPMDKAQAMKWYRRAADLEWPRAFHEIGMMYFNGEGVAKDPEQAFAWIKQAADKGEAEAETQMGWMYEYGKGAPKDYDKARQWYFKAAAKGNSTAENNLGILYWDAKGVMRDYEIARKWLEKAMDHGNSKAPVNLGDMYSNGLGVPKNLAEARRLYLIGKTRGDPEAASKLAAIDK